MPRPDAPACYLIPGRDLAAAVALARRAEAAAYLARHTTTPGAQP